MKLELITWTILLVGTFAFSFFSFVGLLGALNQNLYIRAVLGGDVKHKGMRAVFWGLLFFLGFGFFPFAIIAHTLEVSMNKSLDLIIDIVVLITAFFFAYRRQLGINKTTRSRGPRIPHSR